METPSTPYPPCEHVDGRLQQLEKVFLGGRPQLTQIQAYYDLAVSSGQIERARRCFEALFRSQPGLLETHSLYISLCLQSGDNQGAMTAIETLVGKTLPSDEFLDAALAVRQRLEPKQVEVHKPHTISLCMIVRDEFKFIGPCLSAIKPLVDEIILVDTGSKDRTADIGRLFGAGVYDFEWCDDFAAARNFGLSKASGQWVLVLDADEMIAPSDFKVLHNLIRTKGSTPVAFSIETRNYCYSANLLGWQANCGDYPAHETGLGWFSSVKVRLFPRNENVRFHYPVHERVDPSLGQAGIATVKCTVPVHHYGHLNEHRNLTKARKYFELGWAKLDCLKDDIGAIRELAVQAGQLERWMEAIRLWEKLLHIKPEYQEAFINLGSAHWQLGNYDQSLEWSRKAQHKGVVAKESLYNEALSLLMLRRFDQAQVVFENVLTTHRDYLAAAFMLCVAYTCAGKLDKARQLMHRLKQTAARKALPEALVEIQKRMRTAGMVLEADRLNCLKEGRSQ